MPRPKIDRKPIFKMFSLSWDKKKIRREGRLSERSYFMLKAEFEALSPEEQETLRLEAMQEAKVKERFEDHELVQKWIQTMQSEKIKSWKGRVAHCRRVWLLLDKKNPQNWTVEDIKLRAIPKLREGRKSIFQYLVAIRSLRPDFKEAIKTKREKAPINIDWRYAYKHIVQKGLIQDFFECARLVVKDIEISLSQRAFDRIMLEHELETIVRMHVTLGCREGGRGEGGIINIEWERVDFMNKTIDVYEGKTGGGFYWLDCPLDLFGDKTFNMLNEWHIMCGKPQKGKVFANLRYHGKSRNYKKKSGIHKVISLNEMEPKTKLPYINLLALYHFIGETLNLPKKISPHFARKLHASLLRKSGVPLEVVSGEAPHGIVGVGWEDLTTLKKFYVSFADEDIRKAKDKARHLDL